MIRVRRLATVLGSTLLAASLFGVPGVAAQSRVGTTASPFLTLGTGARGQALGHAYTTLAKGGDALFWNPAGAARPYDGIYRGSLFLTHYEWLADINYNAAGIVVPGIGPGSIGLSIASVDYGSMEVRTVELPEGTGESFTASDLSMGVTYAQPLTNTFYFGGTMKYVRENIRDMSAHAIAFDFGFVLETNYLNGLQLSASIMNFGQKMQMEGINVQVFVDIDETNSGNNPDVPGRLLLDSWDLPLSFKFGVGLPVFETSFSKFMLLAEANQSNDNNLNSDFGALLQFGNKTVNFELRGGYKDAFVDNVDSHLTFGAGLDLRVSRLRVGFDFAYIPFDLLGDTQMADFRAYF